MDRLRLFLMFQWQSLRALFRLRRYPSVAPYEENPRGICHPSQLCQCNSGKSASVLADHDPGCRWVAVMCEGCAGTGWCVRCGGDGTAPDWDPERTPPERPSSRRIA